MTVRKRAIKNLKPLNIPVSYRVLDKDKLSDARNIFDNKGVQETRYGIKPFIDVSLGGSVLSLSFFKKSNGDVFRIAKVGAVLYSVKESGAHDVLVSGLSANTKHRGITLNDRHIIAIEGDGLYSFNGVVSEFTTLGQDAPTGISVAIANGGSLTDATYYKVAVTFYSSETGFESNAFESGIVTTASPNLKINVTSIPSTASSATIDTIRIYLKNTEIPDSEFNFVHEMAMSISNTSYSITADTPSTQHPPTTHAPPVSGGGKYLVLFGKKLAYSGNGTFPNDVYFSEEYLPDAFDNTITANILQIPGQGPITAIASGFYDESYLNPYLVIFKKNSITIYSELGGVPVQATIEQNIGCISHDTVREANGLIYFMSENGWYVIKKGSIHRDSDNQPISLGNGDIDDIFSRVGWTYELNIPNAENFFSAYYLTNSHYMTFVSEGSNNSVSKAYVFEEKINGFRVFDFKWGLTCACEGEDTSGYRTLFLGGEDGTIYTYSARNDRSDEDFDGDLYTIPVYMVLSYVQPGEDSSSYNFRTLAVRALSSINAFEVKAYPTFSVQSFESFSFDFPNTALGFTLDTSQLDIDVLGDERIPVTIMYDLCLTGETLLLGFYQDVENGNIGLLSAEQTLNKNGNRNL